MRIKRYFFEDSHVFLCAFLSIVGLYHCYNAGRDKYNTSWNRMIGAMISISLICYFFISIIRLGVACDIYEDTFIYALYAIKSINVLFHYIEAIRCRKYCAKYLSCIGKRFTTSSTITLKMMKFLPGIALFVFSVTIDEMAYAQLERNIIGVSNRVMILSIIPLAMNYQCWVFITPLIQAYHDFHLEIERLIKTHSSFIKKNTINNIQRSIYGESILQNYEMQLCSHYTGQFCGKYLVAQTERLQQMTSLFNKV